VFVKAADVMGKFLASGRARVGADAANYGDAGLGET
jgi:hypothetical protein